MRDDVAGVWRVIHRTWRAGRRGPSEEALDPLADQLRTYASEHVGASEAVLGRIERQVVGAYQDRFAVRAAAGSRSAMAVRAEPGRGRRWRFASLTAGRTVGVMLGVSILASGSSIVLAESAPGHPLYTARLAVEALTLPARGSQARLDAQLVRLDHRVTEARTAAERGDWHATEDALSAYRQTLDEVAELGRQPSQDAARIRVTLAAASDSLAKVATRVPAGTRHLAHRALIETTLARQSLDHAP